jgi:hypothetical protein
MPFKPVLHTKQMELGAWPINKNNYSLSLLKDQNSRYNDLQILPAYAHNPCIKKGGGITTTIIDLQILHLDSTLPNNQNKASLLSLLSYCIENTDLTS